MRPLCCRLANLTGLKWQSSLSNVELDFWGKDGKKWCKVSKTGLLRNSQIGTETNELLQSQSSTQKT